MQKTNLPTNTYKKYKSNCLKTRKIYFQKIYSRASFMVCVKTCIPSENFELSHFEILKRNGKTVQQMASVSFKNIFKTFT